MVDERKTSNKFKKYNHYHEPKDFQEIVDLGSGKFIADKQMLPLLKALNECGLVTRTHCYGHFTGHSFVSILLDFHTQITFKEVSEFYSDRKFPKKQTEILISWKRTN